MKALSGVHPGFNLRARDVGQTLRLATRAMPLLGISRVTDITRMDRLGLPVFVAVRPRGRTLRVHAGKGVRVEDARIGALMEAVEYAVAERASAAAPDETLTYAELAARLGGNLQWACFAPRVGVAIPPDSPAAAMRCEDLGRRRRVLLPAELVCIPPDEAWGPPMFGWSTNGLASGNTVEEATLHALFEVLERDAWAMNTARDQTALVPCDSLPAPFDAWSAAWKRAGVELIVRHVPNDFGLPCFHAHLYEAASNDIPLAAGWGLHPVRATALSRAVCEAAQSRLTFIHGGRDDIGPVFEHYADRLDAYGAAAGMAATLRDGTSQRAYADVEEQLFTSSTPDTMLPELLAHMAARGFDRVFRHRFRLPGDGPQPRGLHVVKVVVPMCETGQGAHLRMGPRLLARVLRA